MADDEADRLTKRPPETMQHHSSSTAKRKKQKPKRALSAYNIFFQEERRRVLDERRSRLQIMLQNNVSTDTLKSVETMGFVNLARHIAAKWNELDKESKAHYQALAQQEIAKTADIERAKQHTTHPTATTLGIHRDHHETDSIFTQNEAIKKPNAEARENIPESFSFEAKPPPTSTRQSRQSSLPTLKTALTFSNPNSAALASEHMDNDAESTSKLTSSSAYHINPSSDSAASRSQAAVAMATAMTHFQWNDQSTFPQLTPPFAGFAASLHPSPASKQSPTSNISPPTKQSPLIHPALLLSHPSPLLLSHLKPKLPNAQQSLSMRQLSTDLDEDERDFLISSFSQQQNDNAHDPPDNKASP